MNKDIGVYSNTIQFQTQVYPGVYWVPLNALGKSRYTNNDMHEIAQLPMEERREKIGNLYEAVQLFQTIGFRGVLDNTDHWFNNKILWQTHKSPEQAVLTNEGCCATDSNWLSYFIKNRYDFVGSFCYANRDGNGHITTYIKHKGEYYFLDMMMCRTDSQAFLCRETGLLADLLQSEWAGFLFQAKDPVDFCQFCISRWKAQNRDIPFAFYLREKDSVSATGLECDGSTRRFLIPAEDQPRILYCDEDKTEDIQIVELPEQLKAHGLGHSEWREIE